MKGAPRDLALVRAAPTRAPRWTVRTTVAPTAPTLDLDRWLRRYVELVLEEASARPVEATA